MKRILKLLIAGLCSTALADPTPVTPSSTTATRQELRPYLIGSAAPLRALRTGIERLEDKSVLFVGDSTFYDTTNAGLPKKFADRLAADYTSHRVEFRISSSDASSSTMTALRAGSTRRHWNFASGDSYGIFLPQAEMATSPAAADLSVEVEFSFDASGLSSGLPPSNTVFAGWGLGSGGYMRFVFTSGVLALYWSEDGTLPSAKVASVTMPTLTAGTIYRFRVDLDIDNGASGRTLKFWQSTNSGGSWTQIGSDVVQATATTIHLPAGAVFHANTLGSAPSPGMRIYDVQMFTGSPRVPILPWRIDQWLPPTGIGTNVAPSLEGDPVIYVDVVAQNGATLRTGGFFTGSDGNDMTPNLYRCMRDHRPEMLVIASSHNDDNLGYREWAVQMDAAVTNLLAFLPMDPAVVHVTQNPEPADYGFGLYSGIHNRRQSAIIAYAGARGRTCVDLYGWMIDGYDPDHYTPGDVHPTSAGYTYQFRGFWDCFLEGTSRGD